MPQPRPPSGATRPPSGATATAAAARAAPPAAGGGRKRKRAAPAPAATAAFDLDAWLDDYRAVSAALAAHGDLEARLAAGGGLTKIRGLLPRRAAAGLLALLRSLPAAAWADTRAGRDYAANNISHAFESTKGRAAGSRLRGALEKAFRALSLLLPGSLFTFSAARYSRGHHIEPHDDRAYTDVMMDDGQVVQCSRRVAAIYYLTPDWKEEWGGHLLDMETGQAHVPEFNTLIAFRIPRFHVVTPVDTDQPRYSIFGWFLEPGRLYDLQLKGGEEAEGGGGGGGEADGGGECGGSGSGDEGGGSGSDEDGGGSSGGRGAGGHRQERRAAGTQRKAGSGGGGGQLGRKSHRGLRRGWVARTLAVAVVATVFLGLLAISAPPSGRPLWWFGPIWSGSGYGAEANNFLLSLIRSGLMPRDLIWASDHGGTTMQEYIDGMQPADRADIQRAEALARARSHRGARLRAPRSPPAPIVVCHSMPYFWAAPAAEWEGGAACPPDKDRHPWSYAIARTMYETDRVPQDFADRVNLMDEVWVPSEWQAAAFSASGVDARKIRVVPEGANTSFFDPALHAPLRDLEARAHRVFGPGAGAGSTAAAGARGGGSSSNSNSSSGGGGGGDSSGAGAGGGGSGGAGGAGAGGSGGAGGGGGGGVRPFTFLSSFKWEARKGWDLLLEAYLSEFDSNDAVRLVLLTKPWGGDAGGAAAAPMGRATSIATAATAVAAAGCRAARPDTDLAALYAAADAFVLPSRGEGWGRPHVEAMSMGLPVIATNWSGITAFLDDAVGYPIPIDGLVQAPGWRWGLHWAAPSARHLRAAMRAAAADPAGVAAKGAAARARAVQRYAPAAVARLLAAEVARVEALLQARRG
ncbi:MAG: hypothetical protein J3K34DRAFT_477473 [Monoraphidium minutum]|nr:MAG: hypothetical protein J3K34DRAFT_477473 [Monoraphidium minutum]